MTTTDDAHEQAIQSDAITIDKNGVLRLDIFKMLNGPYADQFKDRVGLSDDARARAAQGRGTRKQVCFDIHEGCEMKLGLKPEVELC